MPLDASSKRALSDIGRKLGTILKVLAAAAIGLWLLLYLSEAQKSSREAYKVTPLLETKSLKLPADKTKAEPHVAAVNEAAGEVEKQGKDLDSRDSLVAALLPGVTTASQFPTAEKVVTTYMRETLKEKEEEIARNRKKIAGLQTAAALAQASVISAQKKLTLAEIALSEETAKQQRFDAAAANVEEAQAAHDVAHEYLNSTLTRIDFIEAALTRDENHDRELKAELARLEPKKAEKQTRADEADERLAHAKAELAIREAAAKPYAMRMKAVEAAQELLAETSRTATSDVGDLNAAIVELDGLIRERNYLADHLNLEMTSLHDQQRQFIATATTLIDDAIKERKDDIKAKRKSDAAEQFNPLIIQAANHESPLHVLYEAFSLLCIALVVMGIAFCAAMLLKLLPFPGSAEKWSSKVEDLAEKANGGGGVKSPAASLLLTATTLGIGAFAVGHVMNEQGSPLYDTAATIPFLHSQSPVASMPVPSFAQPANLNVPSSSGSMFAFSPVIAVSPTPITYSPMNQIQVPAINVPPAQITGLEELRKGVEVIGDQAKATSETAGRIADAFSAETRKTDLLKTAVDDNNLAIANVSSLVKEEGLTARSYIGDFAAMHESYARQSALANTRHSSRTLLRLQRYQVNEATINLFATEEACKSKDDHEKLRLALASLEGQPARYESPFETSIIEQMIGNAKPWNPDFLHTRCEVRKHLPLILEASRIAE